MCFFGLVGEAKTWKDNVKLTDYEGTGIGVLGSHLGEPMLKALSGCKVDIFVHSWSTRQHSDIERVLSPKLIVTEPIPKFNIFPQIINHFIRSAGWKNIPLWLWNLKYSYPKYKNLYWMNRIHAGLSRWTSTARSLDLAVKYELMNDFKYDHIISCRLDLIWKNDLTYDHLIQGDKLVLANFNKTPTTTDAADQTNHTFNKMKCSDLFFSGPRERILKLRKIAQKPTQYPISPHQSSFNVLFEDSKDYKNVVFTLYPWIDFSTYKTEFHNWFQY